MNLLLLLAFTLIVPVYQSDAPSSKPSLKVPYTCNFARIKNLNSGSFVVVRSGPGVRFRKIDRIRGGAEVYVCDERGDWLKVCYSAPDGPCGPTSSSGLDSRKTAGCRTGWVLRELIEIISG